MQITIDCIFLKYDQYAPFQFDLSSDLGGVMWSGWSCEGVVWVELCGCGLGGFVRVCLGA